jgi:hypothetical protein
MADPDIRIQSPIRLPNLSGGATESTDKKGLIPFLSEPSTTKLGDPLPRYEPQTRDQGVELAAQQDN